MTTLDNTRAEKIMVHGRIQPAPVGSPPLEVRRGMKIMTSDGREAGWVAAVILDGRSQHVTHILLGHLPVTADYRLIPVSLIARVDAATIYLYMPHDAIENLAIHQPD